MAALAFVDPSLVKLQCRTCLLYFLADSRFPFDQCPDCMEEQHKSIKKIKVYQDMVDRRMAYREKHRQELNDYARKYYAEHREKMLAYQRDYNSRRSRMQRDKTNTAKRYKRARNRQQNIADGHIYSTRGRKPKGD